MAQGQAEAVKQDVGSLLLYTPVVHPAEFDVAIAYLIRRLEEGASQDNFMSAVFELSDERRPVRAREAALPRLPGRARRRGPAARTAVQNRSLPAAADAARPASRTPRTPTRPLPANRDWGRAILDRVAGPRPLGNAAVEAADHRRRSTTLNTVIATAVEKGKAWGALSGAERAEILHRAGDVLEARRADLLEVMASETGKTIDQGDPEVSEAVDFAHYYAESRPQARRRRRRHLRPGEAHRGHPAVELPGRHPGRLHARGARRRLRRRHQARQAGPRAAAP